MMLMDIGSFQGAVTVPCDCHCYVVQWLHTLVNILKASELDTLKE